MEVSGEVYCSDMIADTSVSFTNQQLYTHCGGVVCCTSLQQYHEIIANDVVSLLDSCAAEHMKGFQVSISPLLHLESGSTRIFNCSIFLALHTSAAEL